MDKPKQLDTSKQINIKPTMHDLMILAIVCYIFLHKGILKRVVNQNIQYHLNNYTQGSKFPFPTPSIYESAKKHPELMQALSMSALRKENQHKVGPRPTIPLLYPRTL